MIMAGLAHLGVGLAAKRVAPGVPAPVLVVAAYAIDIVWGAFWLAGVEPDPGVSAPAPWSHGLFMSLVWSATAALIAWLISHNKRTTLIIGLLAFSHWVIDFIAKPMTHAYPGDVGVTLLLGGSPVVGLGAWGTATREYIGEYGTTALGLVIYAVTAWRLRSERRPASPVRPTP